MTDKTHADDVEDVPPTERLTKGDTDSSPKVAYDGDAKIVIPPGDGAGHGGLVGMSKKELMRYANDPFWIRLRRGLFVLFWLVWFGMLLASVFIIWDAVSHGGCTGKEKTGPGAVTTVAPPAST